MLGVDRAVDPVVRLAVRRGRTAAAGRRRRSRTSAPALTPSPVARRRSGRSDRRTPRPARALPLDQLQPEPDSDLTPADRASSGRAALPRRPNCSTTSGSRPIDQFVEHSHGEPARLERATSSRWPRTGGSKTCSRARRRPTAVSDPADAPRSDPVGIDPEPVVAAAASGSAQQRSVGHVGSVPLLVEGLVGPAPGQSPAGSSGSPEDRRP